MKFLFLTLTSQKHDHGGNLTILRCDLTRKIECLNTWVPDVLDYGHDVLFFDGGYEKLTYDPDALILHLTDCDDYEPNYPNVSNLFKKIQSAFKWVLENKDFDYLYLHDDDIYINMHEFNKIHPTTDFKGTSLGGYGFFFTKRAMQKIIDYENSKFHVADHAIYNCMATSTDISRSLDMSGHCPFYIPGELYSTIHYVCGRRGYFLNNMFRFYQENGYTNRKIIFGFPFDATIRNEFITYEVEAHRKTKRDYDFILDKNGWEYHSDYSRSTIINVDFLLNFWPYASNSTKYFIVNFEFLLKNYNEDQKPEIEKILINKFTESLINKDNLLLCSRSEYNSSNWKLDESAVVDLKLNFEDLSNWKFYRQP
jgi:hypothetical protein